MYRKNLMRVCLAAIMAATVVTTSVPVYAAEPVATKQETADVKYIKVKVCDNETGQEVASELHLGITDEELKNGVSADTMKQILSHEKLKGYTLAGDGSRNHMKLAKMVG